MTNLKDLGLKGEAAAREYLERCRYEIVEHNYRAGHKEIDLIARRNGRLIFFEIKTRIKTAASLMENPLGRRQSRNLQRAMLDYCAQNRISLNSISLDLIVILVDRKTQSAALRHYRNIL